jgi:pimeloyl-ACP methyl ester carboxylesterase
MSTADTPVSKASLARWYPQLRDARIDGSKVRYLDAGSGPPVLLVHGIGCSWTHWAANLDDLTAHHRVIAVDLPGFGASDPLAPGSELVATADVLLALMDSIGVGRFAIVGHSLGGLISWLVTAQAPERILRLGLVDAATVELTALQAGTIVRSFTLGGRWLANPGVARAILRRPRLRKVVLANLFADHSGVTPELAVALLTPLTAAPGFNDALAAAATANRLVKPEDVHTPTLIVWGTKDLIFSVAAARKLASRMPDATLLEIRGARHWPQLERPAQFNPALLEFLAVD